MSDTKKPQIKAIIFDLGGVVMHGGFLPFIQEYCAACMTPEGKKKIHELERSVNAGEITEHEFYEKVREIFDVRLTPEEMHTLIVDRMQTDKELVEYIPKLKKSKIALFSNSIGDMAEEVLKRRHVPAEKIFDQMFMSNKIQRVKPDSDAYRYILSQLDVDPQEALMVDDREENIKGARSIGMHGIVYKNAEQFKKEIASYELI